MIRNTIVNDFGDDGLNIDISTKSNTGKTLLIDREFYENNDGFIYQQGRTIVIRQKGGRPIGLGRFMFRLSKGDKSIVVCKDRLSVDYRSGNLEVRTKHGLKHRPRTRSYIKIVRDIKIKEMEERRQRYMD